MAEFLVLVDAAPDEAQRVTREQAQAALAWLRRGLDEQWISSAGAYPHTGGYMVVHAESVAALSDLLDDYPLRSTITIDVRPVVSLRQGFAVLLTNIDAAQPAHR